MMIYSNSEIKLTMITAEPIWLVFYGHKYNQFSRILLLQVNSVIDTENTKIPIHTMADWIEWSLHFVDSGTAQC